MALSQADRIAFSLKIVTADSEVKSLTLAKNQLQSQLSKIQNLDTANKNLFNSVHSLVTSYQNEFKYIDGNIRTTTIEQDIVDSANRKFGNHFFPNDVNTVVPSLASLGNIWPRTKPFALTYSIGKNYTEGYGTNAQNENSIITTMLGYITSALSFTDIELTTGQHCVPTNSIVSFPSVQTLRTNLSAAVNSISLALVAEVAAIPTNDKDPTRQAQNNAAINNINNVIVPALNTWFTTPTFNTAHGQTTCVGFNGFDSNTLAPTQLHSTQLAALQTALLNRQTFLSTRTSQLNTNLGSITQDITTGNLLSSTGLYGQNYGFLLLRLDSLSGTLTQLSGLQSASSAQDSMISSINQNKATYLSILPTSLLQAPASGTSMITAIDANIFSPGDTVYLIADNQDELQRAVKSITGNLITLNDIIPAKYRPSDNARIYKDIS